MGVNWVAYRDGNNRNSQIKFEGATALWDKLNISKVKKKKKQSR